MVAIVGFGAGTGCIVARSSAFLVAIASWALPAAPYFRCVVPSGTVYPSSAYWLRIEMASTLIVLEPLHIFSHNVMTSLRSFTEPSVASHASMLFSAPAMGGPAWEIELIISAGRTPSICFCSALLFPMATARRICCGTSWNEIAAYFSAASSPSSSATSMTSSASFSPPTPAPSLSDPPPLSRSFCCGRLDMVRVCVCV